MESIASNLQEVKRRIAGACLAAGRGVDDVCLLAVSKTFDADAVRAAFDAGQRAFGENYVQEALNKMAALSALQPRPQWHFIGPLQSNKTRQVAAAFDWVHSVDRLKTAERLAAQRPDGLPPLNLCLQVNISGESSKNGAALGEVPALARAIAALPSDRIRMRGLMAIPAVASNPAEQRAPHRALHDLLQVLRADGLALDTLSMGMSADLEAAVAEGATLLRVGSAVFGNRG